MKTLFTLAATAAIAFAADASDCCADNTCSSQLLRIRTTNFDGDFVAFNEACPAIEGENHNDNGDNFHLAPLARFTPHDYVVSTTSGLLEQPVRVEANGAANPRSISNCVHQAQSDKRSAAGLTDMVTFWGQFLDHDVGETLQVAGDAMDIDIPLGDPVFDAENTGAQVLGFERSVSSFPVANGPREQLNELPAWIDSSNVYGETNERAAFLRSFNNGELRSIILRGEEFPPLNNAPNESDRFANANQGGLVDPTTLFVAGDARSNEQPTLLVMHTLFVREHNWHANRIASVFPEASDEEIFQLARRFVIAEAQVITYEAWLPALAGDGLLPPYDGHDPTMDAAMFNYFPHASFRLGHTLLNDVQTRLDANGDEHPALNAFLADGFFNPQVVWAETGLTPYLRGLVTNVAQEMDNEIIDSVRNLLFGNIGFVNGDLGALNIQRGRDHGLPGYEAVRRAFGLATYDEWTDVTSNLAVAIKLHSAFGAYPAPCQGCDAPTPESERGNSCCLLGGTSLAVTDPARHVDPFSVALAEDPVGGGNLGSLNYAVFQEVFTRFREGDFFHYLNPDYLLPQQREYVTRQTLGDIVVRNSDVDCTPEDVFINDGAFSFPCQ